MSLTATQVFHSRSAMQPMMAAPVTMTSREIAELVESRHDSVKRTIERLAESGVIVRPPLVDGRKSANGVVESVYRIGKRDSYVIVAQLSPEFTARLVDRWQELEAAAAPAYKLPQTYSQALRLAAEQAETIEAQAAMIEAAKPAVAFVDNYVAASTGSKGFREVCKLLKANESDFREFLLDKKIMYRLAGAMTPHAEHLNAGRFEVKTGANGEHVFTQAKFTPKGIEWVAGEWAKHQIAGQM